MFHHLRRDVGKALLHMENAHLRTALDMEFAAIPTESKVILRGLEHFQREMVGYRRDLIAAVEMNAEALSCLVGEPTPLALPLAKGHWWLSRGASTPGYDRLGSVLRHLVS